MSDNENNENKPNIFQKIAAAGNSWLDSQIIKGQSIVKTEEDDESDYFYRKSIVRDSTHYTGSQGFIEKPHRLTFNELRQMALKNSIVAAIIRTRQNQVAGFSKLSKNKMEKGFKIRLLDEQSKLEEIIDELEEEQHVEQMAKPDEQSEPDLNGEMVEEDYAKYDLDDDREFNRLELERKARDLLEKKYSKRRRYLEDFIVNCGRKEDRPFESRRWNLDTILRATIQDSFTYDQFGWEIVPDNAGKPHHIVPADGSTIRYASPSLKNYKGFTSTAGFDILYPEKEIQALEENGALELDENLLEEEKYKYVQVVKGKIERAFTADELKVGHRNPTTDIYVNGYPIPELELLVALVTSHLNAEYYNQAYYTQGFSAKGILHIKAALSRRKLETIRQQWYHMIRGSKNSFQTPIFSGIDEVKWIPLTQNHTDIEFAGWMQYLIKMICSIYQIDPAEIGTGFKEQGGSGGGLSGDNTQEKLDQSKDKGLLPLLRFLENFINANIIDSIDPDFCFEFVGVKDESPKEALDRQEKEVKFKKTVNEIRAEDGLPPLPGMDDIILDQNYILWYNQYSKKAKDNQQEIMQQEHQLGQENVSHEQELAEQDRMHEHHLDKEAREHEQDLAQENIEVEASKEDSGVEKSQKIAIEYYTLDD